MASVPDRRSTPTTAIERQLLDDLAAALLELGLEVDMRADLRTITAKQPAVTGAGAIPVGLSQVVNLARSRAVAGRLAWVITLEDGFRGTNGSQYEAIAQGDDVAEAARKIGRILALTEQPAPAPDRESVA